MFHQSIIALYRIKDSYKYNTAITNRICRNDSVNHVSNRLFLVSHNDAFEYISVTVAELFKIHSMIQLRFYNICSEVRIGMSEVSEKKG